MTKLNTLFQLEFIPDKAIFYEKKRDVYCEYCKGSNSIVFDSSGQEIDRHILDTMDLYYICGQDPLINQVRH